MSEKLCALRKIGGGIGSLKYRQVTGTTSNSGDLGTSIVNIDARTDYILCARIVSNSANSRMAQPYTFNNKWGIHVNAQTDAVAPLANTSVTVDIIYISTN